MIKIVGDPDEGTNYLHVDSNGALLVKSLDDLVAALLATGVSSFSDSKSGDTYEIRKTDGE